MEAMRRAIEIDGTHAPAWWRLGGWLLDADEVDTAQEAFAKAASLAPGDPEGVVGLARVDLRRGDAEAAIERLDPLVAGPARNHPLVNQLLATALVRVGRGEEAEAAFTRARRGGADPVDAWLADANPYRADLEAQLDAAKGLAMNGRFGEAITRLEMLGRAHPDNATIRVNLAVVHRARGDLATSRSILEETIAAFPESAPARYNLALSRFLEARRPDGSFDVSRFGPAVVQLDAAIASNPSYAPAHGLYGDIHTARGTHGQAVASFERATVADPANPLWRMQLGLAEMRAGNPGRAVEILRALVDEAPQAPDALRALGQALAADGRAAEAASAFGRAEQLAAERRPGGRP
jgi:Flp pilus assembly protein TadD